MSNMLLAIVLAMSQAKETTNLNEIEVARILQPHYQSQAAGYRFAFADVPQQPFEFVTAPIMRWTDSGNSGGVWVWTHLGRPEVIGCLGAIAAERSGQVVRFHEFHSLALKPLASVDVAGVRTWASPKPGIVLQPLEGAEAPASNEKLRLIQMRNLARQFAAEMKSHNQMHVLRLSSTPLFRYSEKHPGILDGAIFSYLWDQGTDPELLLLIEARTAFDERTKDSGGRKNNEVQWYYAPVRFTWRELWLKLKDREVWHAEQSDETHRRQTLLEPYVTVPLTATDVESLRSREESTK